MNNGPLTGLRVVEFQAIGPGPHVAMLLADLGAEVVRIERPGHRPMNAVVERGRRADRRHRRLRARGIDRRRRLRADPADPDPARLFLERQGDPDRRVVLGRGDRLAGRDLGLGLGEIGVDPLEGLQRDHRAVVGQNAGHVCVVLKLGGHRTPGFDQDPGWRGC